MLKRHRDFRLWLTTEADEKFPAILLQESIKLTFEAPPGIKNNVLRSCAQWRDSAVERLPTLCGLSWMHALIQERRAFIPQVSL